MTNPTDTNQASELYKLFSEVYKRTGWETDELLSHRGLVRVPLYTSDYLLEKLLPITSIQLKRKANGDIRLFYFPEKPDYATYDYDTPLKCLLALTIALSEAGELK